MWWCPTRYEVGFTNFVKHAYPFHGLYENYKVGMRKLVTWHPNTLKITMYECKIKWFESV
jgi:hypothetical protein